MGGYTCEDLGGRHGGELVKSNLGSLNVRLIVVRMYQSRQDYGWL